MRYCIYVYRFRNASDIRFNACFPLDEAGRVKAVKEARWYAERGYGVVMVERPDDLSRYVPPLVLEAQSRPAHS